jgi:agmatine deiminase
MPAEFAPHERTVLCWPARTSGVYGNRFSEAEAAHAEVARAISHFEPVTVIADTRQYERARMIANDNIDVLHMPIDDAWFRDSGPIFVHDTDGVPTAIQWRFNSWGEKFIPFDNDATIAKRWAQDAGYATRVVDMVLEGGSLNVNGEGTLVTTIQCLLNPNRNPTMSKAEIEATIRFELGIDSIMWLPYGLSLDDDTDGHVDNVAAFADSRTLVVQGCNDRNEDDWARLHTNKLIAHDFVDGSGNGFNIVEIPVLPFTEIDDQRVVVPYLNFYVGNGFVLVPVCGNEADADMLDIIRDVFPGREVVGLDVGAVLALGGGGIHCITQQVPSARSK